MALFSRTKKVDAPAKIAEAKVAVKGPSIKGDLSHVLRSPRITEKASMLQSGGAYVFDISMSATKPQIDRAIREMYKVTPRMIRVVTIPAKIKRSMRTGRVGVKSGGRKAYVFLKKGETITLA